MRSQATSVGVLKLLAYETSSCTLRTNTVQFSKDSEVDGTHVYTRPHAYPQPEPRSLCVFFTTRWWSSISEVHSGTRTERIEELGFDKTQEVRQLRPSYWRKQKTCLSDDLDLLLAPRVSDPNLPSCLLYTTLSSAQRSAEEEVNFRVQRVSYQDEKVWLIGNITLLVNEITMCSKQYVRSRYITYRLLIWLFFFYLRNFFLWEKKEHV